MGLDMYALAVPKSDGWAPTSRINTELPETANKIAYWRKFNALHGWMTQLYLSLGGSDAADFNCVPLQLTHEDLDALENDLDQQQLKPIPGFFFGDQCIYQEDRDALRAFITLARDIIGTHHVFYNSWW